MKIITVIGARPQFIKAATVSRVIAQTEGIDELIVHTGQHYDRNMSDIFFDEMNIPRPNYHFSINGKGHGAMTGEMLTVIEKVLIDEKPDWVLVYGDTNSTLAGALAASKLHIKVAHVEAGLRSFNFRMPEEQNRILTDRVSSVLFCPTDQAMLNLKNEGYENLSVTRLNVGDVMYDAASYYSKLNKEGELVTGPKKDFILATCHRAENTNDKKRLSNIVSALNELSKVMKIVFPLHPRTKNKLVEHGLSFNFEVIDPVGYLDMINLLKNTRLVLTDSGGLQKEAYFFNKPCVTMRDETEWVELVHAGVNKLSGSNSSRIISDCKHFLDESSDFPENIYGDGKAANKIVDYLVNN